MKNKVILDSRISKSSVVTLLNMGFEPIFIPKSPYLQEPVSAHPDMSVAKIGKRLFVAKGTEHLFYEEDCIECNMEERMHLYPDDIAFNCAVVGNYVFCKKDYLDKEILKYLEENDFNIINTKQGYAKCSTCVVSDNAIITEDDNIVECALNAGIDALKIRKGYVKLDGYDYGFIGGASGLLNKNLLCFNGCIENHHDFSAIRNFCLKHNVELLSLNNEPLYDVGSIITIN